jgi:eukaryotic-like serine/threonine-protein kinase
MHHAATTRRSAVPTPQIAARVGCWRLARHVARSAWFDVFLAAPADAAPDWPADYVVKCPRSDCRDAAYARELLAREVHVSGQVTHPHLVTVLDSQLQCEPVFVTQPCYVGHTLRQVLKRRGALAISTALWIARQTADALSALHAAGWRHGDVKPANMIVSAQGHTTLIDLGFAERCSGVVFADPHSVIRGRRLQPGYRAV